jgi:transketolase
VAIVARTVKGRGVSFMEHRMEWHYLPLTDEQYQAAVAEISGR